MRVYREENGKKVYIYTVPAILDATGITRTVYTARRSMSHAIMDSMTQASSRPAAMRDKIVYDNISRADVGRSTENEKAVAEWNYILRLYGKTPISNTLPERVNPDELKPLAESSASKATGNTSVAVEGFEDDDW